ncbi:MAG: transglutaminase family protein [Pseudomonadota bacterium]
MAIHVALSHKTIYRYDRLVELGPQVIRLRPAPHCRTRILSYALKLEPADHFLNWQQDPQNNYLARVVVNEPTDRFEVHVDLTAEMAVYNPFDFFLEPDAETFPFSYEPKLMRELAPFLVADEESPKLDAWMKSVPREEMRTIDFLVNLNQRLSNDIDYLVRMEPGVQTCEQTLTKRSGSCRDSGWLLVQILRRMGLAARFVSGYLIQLKPDVKSLDGPSGTDVDFTDLHAWTEVYLPGAGWIGLDPTSGLLAGEGHLPLAASPEPTSAAPITGVASSANVDFSFDMKIERVFETPRVTKPYTRKQWERIDTLGKSIDKELQAGDVRLTMGGEPTFVSIDHVDNDEWNTEAVGPTKRGLAANLIERLRKRFAPNGMLHFGQGKWYPGESLPRWAFAVYWRSDDKPLWQNGELIGAPRDEEGALPKVAADEGVAEAFLAELATELGVGADNVVPAFEDPAEYLKAEQDLPVNVDPIDNKLEDPEKRARIAKVFSRGLGKPAGYVLPIQRWQSKADKTTSRRWQSEKWVLRRGRLFLAPGDSPVGYRMPLGSLPYISPASFPYFFAADPFRDRDPLPEPPETRSQPENKGEKEVTTLRNRRAGAPPRLEDERANAQNQIEQHLSEHEFAVRTAFAAEMRAGNLSIFMPPTESAEDYVELVGAIETVAQRMETPVLIEGYSPPPDDRLNVIKVTPDPGVIEVNVHPAHDWPSLTEMTKGLYEDAYLNRLGTEKFMIDGRHTGTGGGNHLVVGGATPSDSPFLRRPDLLRSIVTFWQNHPSLSYLFSGLFIGPTSQAPRIDEARHDALYELEIAFSQIRDPYSDDHARTGGEITPPWLIDRILRDILTDSTGNTHRTEICIDKLYSPDGPTGRLGLVEFRAFEMPPHAEMSLAQQLLLRALIARFWKTPYKQPLVPWGTALNDRFMLPHFVWADFEDVIADMNRAGYPVDAEWFKPHFEFRFPLFGDVIYDGVKLELRQALEPWHVLGEDGTIGGTARNVDSSVERLQLKVSGMRDERHMIGCNGIAVPLTPTGIDGEYVAGVRFRAWQPARCLHPTIGVHSPLTFDVFDRFHERSLGGCVYHVAHPGGRSYETFPVNSYEAESRRLARFVRHGHSPAGAPIESLGVHRDFPLTLDLRRLG